MEPRGTSSITWRVVVELMVMMVVVGSSVGVMLVVVGRGDEGFFSGGCFH